MKILVVVPDSDMGGVTSSAVNFCNELDRRGNEVVFLDMSGRLLCDEQLNINVKRGELSGRSCLWNLGKSNLRKGNALKRILLAALGLIKKITNKRGLWYKLIFKKYKQFGDFDVAVAFRQCAPCYSFVLNKIKAKKRIGFVHGELRGMGDISSWKKHMTHFDKIAYVSHAVKDEFVRAYPELENNACTVYNMLSAETIKKRSADGKSKQFDKHKINIVTVSRIENQHKRIDRIAPLCKRLKENGIVDFSWTVVGDGPDYEKCLYQAKELRVDDVLHFCGKSDNPYPYIAEADFTVLPSRTEAFGLVVMESLILGKPVVACEYPALRELLDDGVTGLVAGQDDDSLYCTVSKMITDNEIRQRLSAHCSEFNYSNDKAYLQFTEAVG